MLVDGIARVEKMKGKYVIKRRGMYLNDIFKTETEAQKVCDRWNDNTKVSRGAKSKSKK